MLSHKLTTLGVLLSLSDISFAQKPVIHANINPIDVVVDGKIYKNGYLLSPETNPDELITTASSFSFITDCDSITFDLKEWEQKDFAVIMQNGDTANIRVSRKSRNPFENPDPNIRKIANSGFLTKEQATFDINALTYAINQIHPDMFSVCKSDDFMKAVNHAISTLPDSVSQIDLYKRIAPVVAMIGDGHTSVWIPYNSIYTPGLKELPVYGNITNTKEFICTASLDSIIPVGAKVLSINGIAIEDMIDSMLPYMSGERLHYRLSCLDSSFPALQEMLYHTDEYNVSYIPVGASKPLAHTFQAATTEEIKSRCRGVRKKKMPTEPYSYTSDSINSIAVMNFERFNDIQRMEVFADSMFRDLNEKGIKNLIIDIRNNPGGNSGVGDVLLRYLSDEPFMQIEKMFTKITPVSQSLIEYDIIPQLTFTEFTPNEFIKPRTKGEGHYDGNVYLLISNHSFSSASMFSWTFKECGMGTVVGEETGGMNVHYGDVLIYQLPVSKLSCSVPYKKFWQLRADEDDIHGTLPDIAVPASQAMETAIELISNDGDSKR